ncbi:MAG: hypothetical protein ABI134_05975 [Byssovorax sp.]
MTAETRDAAFTIGLVVTFAALVTIHVVTLFGLARRRHFTAALGSLVLPPLAPYCAFTRGMHARAIAWVASAALYAVALLLNR